MYLPTVSVLPSIDLKNVRVWGDLAFAGCSSLTSITLPDTLKTISAGDFRRCTSLTSITLPDTYDDYILEVHLKAVVL